MSEKTYSRTNGKEEKHLKEEIVSSIIDEVINNYLYLTQISSKERDSRDSFKKIMDVQKKPPISTSSDEDHEYNVRNQNRHSNSIVNELELPVSLLISKLHAQSSPTFERLVLDTYVSTSSTIIAKPGEETIDNNDNLLSATSESRQVSKSRGDINENEEMAVTRSPFDLFWCFGFNPEVPILNLSNKNSSKIVFANSQYAVLYDFHVNSMTFIQGHLNTVSCMSVNSTGSIVATADSGSEAGTSRVIVCDERSCILQVLDNVHPYGCQQVGLSFNGDFLVTVSAIEKPVCFKVWEWEKDRNHAVSSVTIKEPVHNVKKLTMHPFSKREFAITFERKVIFANVIFRTTICSLEDKAREKITNCVYNISAHYPSRLGSLTDTTYFEGDKAFALSSTCKGYVVVWEDSFNSDNKNNYRKYIRLHFDCITSVQMVDNKIAVATASGNVSFYDFGLKYLYSYKSLREPIVSISFNLTDEDESDDIKSSHISRGKLCNLVNAALKNEQFSIRDFVVSTENGSIAYFDVSSETYKHLMFPSKELFTALEMLPNSIFLCAGTTSGKCILFDTDERKVKVLQQIKVATNLCQAVSFLKYSPSGCSLACGMYTGDIWLLDPLLLRPTFEFSLTGCKCCITEMKFSCDSKYLIVTDVSFCVSVYYLAERPIIIGQYIAHFKPIVQIQILDATDIEDKELLFFTVSTDRNISLFKIDKENKVFDFIYSRRITQYAEPMYSIYYSSAGLYIGVNNEHQFRLHDPPPLSRDVTVRCRGTFLAPDFGSPIDYMDVLENNGQSYLFFKSKHHIGIHLLPVDGNPYRALGFRASPTEITCSRVHPNGKYVFTISKLCSGISMWSVNTQAVDNFHRSGGEGLEPFLRILGEKKENNIREFFELGQFLHQGESLTQSRTLRNSLPICEVANVLQALGCILTKQDVKEMTEYIFIDLKNLNFNIEYEDFVCLYFNYRKTGDLNIKDLRQAFVNCYAGVYFQSTNHATLRMIQSNPVFDSATFIKMLEVKGEEFSQEELFADFSILTGGEPELLNEENLTCPIPPTMPKEISFKTFVNDILGFDVEESAFE